MKRDINIIKNFQREINLNTRRTKNKKLYKRNKYKQGYYD